MQNKVNTSEVVANHAVSAVIDKFNYELKRKEAMKVLPQYLHKRIDFQATNILQVQGLPRPKQRVQDYFHEQDMQLQPPIEGYITSQIPSVRHSDLQFMRTPSSAVTSAKRHLSSRYASTSEIERHKKKVRIQLNSFQNDGPVQIVDNRQGTSKSFISVRQLESELKSLRSTYLKNLREEAKAKMSMTQQIPSPKRKRIPRQFTFDTNGQLLQKYGYSNRKTVFSPLRTKAISAPKIMKKNKRIPENPQEQQNIQLILQRAETRTGQKKKRQFNNGNKRQVSHVPFISLNSNSKLIQNPNSLPGSKNIGHINSKNMNVSTVRSNMRSTFSPYFNQTPQLTTSLIEQQGQDMNFPSTYNPKQKNENKQGSILKNSRFKNQSIDFNPINVTRDHGIDQYYKIKMPFESK